MVVVRSFGCFVHGCLGMFVVCARGGEVEDYVSVFVKGAEEFSDLCGEGDHMLRSGLFGFVVGCFLVCVVVVGCEEGSFVGGDDVEGFPWYRCLVKGVQSIAHREDSGIVWVTCA